MVVEEGVAVLQLPHEKVVEVVVEEEHQLRKPLSIEENPLGWAPRELASEGELAFAKPSSPLQLH